jgi:transcriptional regulator with XRE-family HTH domain
MTESAYVLLDNWVTGRRSVDPAFRVHDFAAKLGVTRRALYLWRTGEFVPTVAHRRKIEKLTKGAVPASTWEVYK